MLIWICFHQQSECLCGDPSIPYFHYLLLKWWFYRSYEAVSLGKGGPRRKVLESPYERRKVKVKMKINSRNKLMS